MAATKYKLGKGASLSISTDGGTTWTQIKQLKTISYPNSKADFDDITNMDSPGAYHEFAPTTLDAGTADFQGVWNPSDAGQIAASAAFEAQALCQFKHQFAPSVGESTGFVRTFNGYMAAKPGVDAQFDKASTYNGSIKVTGPYTDTPAVSLPTGVTGSTTSASPNITVSSGVGIVAGLNVSGAGIPAGATVVSITGTAMVISANATATASGVTLTFS